MRRIRTTATIAVACLGAVFASSAMALPGDPGVSAPSFRLNPNTLEPGCFSPRNVPSNIDLSSFDLDVLPNEELRVSNTSGSAPFSFNIDEVLVPSTIGGYRLYDTFNRHGNDIAPGEEEGELFAPDANGNGNSDPIDNQDIVLCVSDETAAQNEPYSQEADGLVSAKNRPIVQPKVTALGASALTVLNTYKIGFGYGVERWYTAPTFDGFSAFPTVTDPNAIPSPTFGGALPGAVVMRQRGDGRPYDARRVNDVDKAGESWVGPDPDDGQDIVLLSTGDDTAWTDSNGNGLLTRLTQGDLPISWHLRASLAAPNTKRSVSFSDDALRAWDAAWQAYYQGKGAKPALALAPGTNSPAPKQFPPVNLPEIRTLSGVTTVVTPTQLTVMKQAAANLGKLRSVKFVRAHGKRYVRVFVRSSGKSSKVDIRLYDRKSHRLRAVTKTVKTNTGVRVQVLVPKAASKVKAFVIA